MRDFLRVLTVLVVGFLAVGCDKVEDAVSSVSDVGLQVKFGPEYEFDEGKVQVFELVPEGMCLGW